MRCDGADSVRNELHGFADHSLEQESTGTHRREIRVGRRELGSNEIGVQERRRARPGGREFTREGGLPRAVRTGKDEDLFGARQHVRRSSPKSGARKRGRPVPRKTPQRIPFWRQFDQPGSVDRLALPARRRLNANPHHCERSPRFAPFQLVREFPKPYADLGATLHLNADS